MGGAVSSGSDNNELVDNLMSGKYIRSKKVELVFRALDRADYMTPDSFDHAYKDLAWRSGPLHLSSPCIYSEVMEGLELSNGLSFLNIGSGTGYLSTLVGLILGSQGINHGVEVHPEVYEYALTKLAYLLENSPIVDEFDFCQPKFFNGNGLCLVTLKSGYDRVYCGAGCPTEYESYFRNLIKVGGILVMPLNDTLVQVRRVTKNKWVSSSLLSVTFAPLRLPSKEEAAKLLKLDEQRPQRLEVLSRGAVRAAVRACVMWRNPELREPTRRPPPRARASCPRRICIPVEPPTAAEGLNVLHDLDAENGADEMNALLSLVISMGHNRVAGALRFDRLETGSDSSSDSSRSESSQRVRMSTDGLEGAILSDSDSDTDEDQDNNYDSDGDTSKREPKTTRRVTRSRSLKSLIQDSNGHGSRAQKQDSNGHGSRAEKRNSRNSGSKNKDSKTPKRNSSTRDAKTKKKDSNQSSRNQKQDSGNKRSQREVQVFPPERCSSRTLRIRRRCATRAVRAAREEREARLAQAERDERERCESRNTRATEASAPSTSGRTDSRNNMTQKLSKRKSKDCKKKSKREKKLSTGSSNEDSSPKSSKKASGKSSKKSTRSGMDWEENKTDNDEEHAPSCPKSKAKRQKLDSGIGDSPPGTSSSTKAMSDSSSDDYTDIEDDVDEERENKCPKATSRRAAGGPSSVDARTARVSALMRRGVLQLPLPPALNRFVDLDRSNEE